MDRQFNLMIVIEALQKRWRAIIGITILIVVIAFVITLPSLGMVKPAYESKSLVYASNTAMSERPYLFESDEAVNVNFSVFGSKYDIDRLMGIALSKQMQEHIVEKFNLVEAFNSKEEKYPTYSAMAQLEDRYDVLRNEYDAMEITVITEDRQLSADIANEIVLKMDEIHQGMILSSRNKMIANLEKHLARKNQEVASLSEQATGANNDQLKKTLEMKQMLAMDQLMKYTDILDQFKLINSESLSTIFVMEKAIPALRHQPFRGGFLIASFLASLFTLIFLATVLEITKK